MATVRNAGGYGVVDTPTKVSNTSGSAISNPGIGIRLATISDSFGVPNNTLSGSSVFKSTSALATAMECFSKGQFFADPALSKSVTGETSAQMLSRYNTDIKPNYKNFDVLIIDAGRNDSLVSMADVAASVSNITTMATRALQAGKIVLVPLPNPPRAFGITTDTQRKLRFAVNLAVERFCQLNVGAYFLNYWNDWVDPTVSTGVPAANITVEQVAGSPANALHPSPIGGYRIMRRALDVFSGLFPSNLPKFQGAWDWYDAVSNPYGNLLGVISTGATRFTGTGGDKSNVSGSVPDGYWLANFTGAGDTANIVASIETGSQGYNASGVNRLIVTLSTLAGAADWAFRSRFNAVATPTELQGQYLYAEMLVELSSLTNCSGIDFTLNADRGDGTITSSFCRLSGVDSGPFPWGDGQFLLRTPKLLIPNISGATPLIYPNLGFGSKAGGAGVVKISPPIIRNASGILI